MLTFETSKPITVRIEDDGGSIRIFATEHADTIVEVRPRDQSRNFDV
ncbi:hypothetical protein [Mycobacterium leprae]|nr:hypothetical protein [Mycobacterium leprae]